MPVKNRFAELLPEITAWRRDFHEHPELLFDVHRTAARVAELLRAFGCDEVVEGIGRTGVVGVEPNLAQFFTHLHHGVDIGQGRTGLGQLLQHL